MRFLSIGLLLAAWLIPGLSAAQDVDDVLASGQRTIQLAQASQQRVDQTVEETRRLVDQYRHRVKITGVALKAQPLGFERECATARRLGRIDRPRPGHRSSALADTLGTRRHGRHPGRRPAGPRPER